MRTRRALAVLLPLLVLAACGPAPDPVTPPAPTASASVAPPAPTATASAQASAPIGPRGDFDPVSVGMSVDGAKRLCDEHLKNAKDLMEQIKSLKGKPAAELTYENTIGRFDDMVVEINSAAEFPYLLAVAHPDAAVREAAKLCEPKTDSFNTTIYLDADLAAVLRAYAAKNEALEGEKKRLLADTLRDFRRNGLELPEAKQAELRKMNEELTRLGQDFTSNISSSAGHIDVKPKSLEGLPKEYVAKHMAAAGGDAKDAKAGKGAAKVDKIEISIDYPDYFPFVTYSKDRKAALDLYVKFVNRGGEENVRILEKILKLRADKAALLGYKSWADYTIEPRMAKSAQAVRDFLSQVRAALKEPAKAEMAELLKEHKKLGGLPTDKLAPPDRYYLQDRVRAEKYKLNTQELSNYFEIGAVKKGLLDITQKMYGIEYKEVPAKAWHPDVTAYEVWSEGKPIGKFYLDLYSRPDKFKHMAMFPIRDRKRLADGSYRTPVASLECNFPKPGAEPALLSHEEVVTFFHEFGHVLHHLLTRSDLASYAGTNTVRDFVEAPSQMFEEWPWSREVLDIFARHYQTGAKIPDDLFAAMQKARGFGRALDTQRQLVFATLDIEYHSRAPGFDTTALVEEVQNANDSFAFVKGTHMQSSFGHLIGYDAGYYSYQWALSLSRDVLTRFKKEGLLNPTTAASWRDEVLSKGGGVDEATMVTRFLGRPPNHEAYLKYIRGE
ncbi:MAG: M3 family metallopeptidase [Byssovorax sp.]